MPFALSKLEFERVENMVVNFGWKTVKQEVVDNAIVITLKKTLPKTALPEQDNQNQKPV